MKYYISKYALSVGIEEFDLPVEPNERGGVWFLEHSPYRCHSYSRNEWHLDYPSAAARAEQMRVAKIASLKKQIAKLEKLTFMEPAP